MAERDDVKEVTAKEAAEQIFKIFTSRDLRYGPVPNDEKKKLVVDNLVSSIEKGEPIKVMIGWGGRKNTNLPYGHADMTEAATIKNYKNRLEKVKEFYSKGYEITIHHLDTRMADMNGFEREDTDKYKDSLKEVLKEQGLSENVKIVSDSDLIKANQGTWDKIFKEVDKRVSLEELRQAPAYEEHMKNASHNNSKGSSLEQMEESLRKMVVYKVAEVESGILKDIPYDVRVFFKSGTVKEGQVPEALIYKHFTKKAYKQSFNVGATLNLYTSKKGNAKQPWQSMSFAKDLSEEVKFLSQRDLEERGIRPRDASETSAKVVSNENTVDKQRSASINDLMMVKRLSSLQK